MTLLVIVVVSITCAALLGLQWTGSKAQTTVAAARTDSIATDSVLDSVIGIMRFKPPDGVTGSASYGVETTSSGEVDGSHCASSTIADSVYQDSAVEVLCTPQPGGAAPNHRDYLLQACQYANGTAGRLLAETSIDISDVDPLSGNPQTGATVRVRSWIEEPGNEPCTP